jgi:hypothetical protein
MLIIVCLTYQFRVVELACGSDMTSTAVITRQDTQIRVFVEENKDA